MKKISLIIILVVVQFQFLKAQDVVQKGEEVNTLFNSGGGFGGFLEFNTKVGDINGQSSLLVGGALSAVFSSKVNIGLAGYGLTTEVDADTYDEDNRLYQIDMGYGGLLIEPIIANKKVVHLTVPIIFGVGGAGLRREGYRRISDPDNRDREYTIHQESDVFLVAEPGLNVEVNLLRNVRLDFGATYRYVYDNNLAGLSDEEFSGFTGSVGLKFGWF